MDLEIKRLLHSLEVTANYTGFRFTILACKLVLEDESRLLFVKNEVYAEIARVCKCDEATIERNIRTVVHRAWERQPKRLMEISDCALTEEPAVAEFIDYLTTYLQRTELVGSAR